MAAPGTQFAVLSTLPDLQNFLSSIPQDSTLYIDLEGKNLSRNGTLSTITMLVHSTGMTGLIDIQTLGNAAFITSKPNGKTLDNILEDETAKCFWDVRNDADALWPTIRSVLRASRINSSRTPPALETELTSMALKLVRQDLSLKFMELNRWMKTKKDIRSLMAQDIFTRRPLDDRTVQYCANDVAHLPALQNVYSKRLSSEWQVKVMDESARRVAEACRVSYDPHSELKKLGPWCSQSDRNVLTMDEWLERWEFEQMDTMQQDLFGYDDCYASDPFDGPINSKDAAWDDTVDSCWEK